MFQYDDHLWRSINEIDTLDKAQELECRVNADKTMHSRQREVYLAAIHEMVKDILINEQS